MKVPMLLNAFHTTTGGGVTYLRGILPLLAADMRFQWTLLAPPETLAKMDIPPNVQTWKAPSFGFAKGHLWEQGVLPFTARKRGFKAMLCNANFVPLLARKPMPSLHTTTTAGAVTQGHLGPLYWWALWLLTFASVLRAPKVFALTDMLVCEFTPFPFRWLRRKAVLAPPGVPQVDIGKVKRQAGLVMAVGDFYAQKNYPTLLRAFALLRDQNPNAKLEIVGKPVYPAVAAEIEVLIHQLALDDAVTLVQDIPHAQLMLRLAQAEVFVSTSLVESFNIPMVEAMAAGVPVVCLAAPYVAGVAGDAALPINAAKGGDVPAALAVAIYGVMENTSIRDLLVRRGHARVAGLTWESTAQALLDGCAEAG